MITYILLAFQKAEKPMTGKPILDFLKGILDAYFMQANLKSEVLTSINKS